MQRRSWLLVFALALLAPAFAQQPGRIPTVGVLITHAPLSDPVVDWVRAGFQSLGYEDGRNIRFEFVTAQGKLELLPALARQLVAKPVDAIVAPNEMATRVAKEATREIPIVMFAWTGDPVALGLIDSYSRPGGNVTGIHSLQSDLEVKRVELIKEALPRLSHLAVLWDPTFPRALDDVQRAGRALGLRISMIEVRKPEDLEPAFKSVRQKKAGAVLTMQSPVFYVNRERIAALGLRAGIPVVAGYGEQVHAGFLLSYGVDLDDIFRRAAYFVDRLLKGANPAELPVEQVSKLKLAVNQRTARALNLKISESVLQRADEIVR